MRRAGVAFLLFFALGTGLVHIRALGPFDAWLMGLIRQWVSPQLDLVAGILNYVAAAETTFALAIVSALALWRLGVPAITAAAPLLFLASAPVEFILKFTVDQPVPSADLYRPTLRYLLIGVPTMQSFPSGHSIRMVFIAVTAVGAMGWISGRWAGVGLACLLVPLVALAGWTRAYQGHHWPTDVLGGWLLGAGLALLALSVLQSSGRRRRSTLSLPRRGGVPRAPRPESHTRPHRSVP